MKSKATMKKQVMERLRKTNAYRYVHFHRTNDKPEREWFRQARKNKKAGIPEADSLKQVELILNDPALAIKAKHFQPIHTLESELAETRKELARIRENPEEYIQSEMKATSESDYADIDQMKADLENLESEAKEIQSFNPEPTTKDHESKKSL